MSLVSKYRSHSCGALSDINVGETVRLSGWIHRKRDHGGLVFIDLRDNYGLTQCVMDAQNPCTQDVEDLRVESVIMVTGKVVARQPNTVNLSLLTGAIEIQVENIEVLSKAHQVPLPVNSDQEFPEETRLAYRFLDLRRSSLHQRIILRSQIIASIRQRMIAQGFLEFQTPILTSSSPEGARDYLVPSRLHPGKFYALPQAPQQFKQLLMVSGFDRYFQIAPCFRDEDARADRSPGEFYQLDFEMSFVTQEDVFEAIEPVLHGLFNEFSSKKITSLPFPQITYQDAMMLYGSDKPDLRNPLILQDVTQTFEDGIFELFMPILRQGGRVKAIRVPQGSDKPRRFYESLNDWVRHEGGGGLGYILFGTEGIKGPLAKALPSTHIDQLKDKCGVLPGDSLFFVCDSAEKVTKLAGLVRQKLAQEFELIDQNIFSFCWVVDFPFYEKNEDTGLIEFSHNPFSMPQGGLEALLTKDPLEIKAYQYDIVCNGIELSSGAIRNHLPEVMYKAFEIAGYSAQDVEKKFGGMLNAFKYGAPPHGGCAPGIDRIVMLLAEEKNIREVIAFPMTQKAEDLLMQAPNETTPDRLKELHLQLVKPLPTKTKND